MLKGYRLTRKGWAALFILVLLMVFVLIFTTSAIIGNIDKVIKITNQFASGESSFKPKVIIYFDNKQAQIKPDNLPVLEMILKSAKAKNDYSIEITGYKVIVENGISTDKVKVQYKLTAARQENVKKYFVDNGLSSNKIFLKLKELDFLRINNENIDDEKEVRKIEVLLKTK